ncbi:hypothetical protein [Pajaroellobacter abortibovis]|uniref:hypothetical protein n=1 Tax=Pajaroellobacter abortibovis TaxID=1882918 RepID=UPI0012EC9CAE|nr:hypothetical protein [Pajaroellobacter abortibovis]
MSRHISSLLGRTHVRTHQGGIYDQPGGGFHRHSMDERWKIPHFEKMLYDQALLLQLYGDAFRVFSHFRYKIIA